MAHARPASPCARCAGAYFDFCWGSLLVYLGNVIGQTVSFTLARHHSKSAIHDCISSRWKRFYLIDTAIKREGAALVFVLRLNPCIPYTVLNYALGLTSISLFQYSWSSAVSIVPFVVSFVYMGCLSTNVAELLDGGWAAHGHMLPWAMASGVFVVCTVVYGYWFTKRALADALEDAMTPRHDEAPQAGRRHDAHAWEQNGGCEHPAEASPPVAELVEDAEREPP